MSVPGAHEVIHGQPVGLPVALTVRSYGGLPYLGLPTPLARNEVGNGTGLFHGPTLGSDPVRVVPIAELREAWKLTVSS
jgi:hypothetical protein